MQHDSKSAGGRFATDSAKQTGVGDSHEPQSREIKIWLHRDLFVQFEGSAAQILAEGLIPDGFEWPRAAVAKCWEANGLEYSLQRSRPGGHKGPMRSWLELDNWIVRTVVAGRDAAWRRHRDLERRTEELCAEYDRLTPTGHSEWAASMERHWASCKDEKFRAFKAMIPGLIPPKRGRKPKAASACKAVTHG